MAEQTEWFRYFLIGGEMNGGSFGITLKSKRHVSQRDIKAHFTGHGETVTTLLVTSIYEFRDEADFNDYEQA